MRPNAIEFHDESRCQEIDSFLADRIYEFNAKATGYADGRLFAGTIQDDAGEIIAGVNGYTWGGCCEITHLWVHERYRSQGLGQAVLRAAETEALHRGCQQVVLMTHSFQAPDFYERFGYERKYEIEDRPRGYSDIVYVKRLDGKETKMREVEVYGRRLLVERTADGWHGYNLGADGKRQLSPAVLIPRFVVSEEELLQYLADLWHESARPDRQTVRWIR